MTKDAYYFSHDSNARNDQRLMKVRMEYGMEGYGIYFGIIEILREQYEYSLYINDLKSIAFDLRADLEQIKDIVMNYNLFKIEGDLFYSKSLKKRMEKLDIKKQKRAEAGRLGGLKRSKNQAKIKQSLNDAKAVKKSKEDKIKEDEINIDFEEFWNLYDYKVGSKIKLRKKWSSLKDEERIAVMDNLPGYKNSTPDKQYRKHPERYLNNRSWEDEIVIETKLEYDLDGTGNFYKGYCEKCNSYASYDLMGLRGDSKCCKAKILNKKKKIEAYA